MLEQSCVVWSSGLSQDNINDFERIQKTACKIILQEKYKNYTHALAYLGLKNLQERRDELMVRFSKSSLTNEKMKHHFLKNNKTHQMNTRNPNTYQIIKTNTERFKKSSIIQIQTILNRKDNI